MIREVTGQGALNLHKIRAAEDAVFCGFRILGEPLTIRASSHLAGQVERSSAKLLLFLG